MKPEMLYEHYVSTKEQQKEFLSKRDRYTIYLLLTIVVYALLMSSPQLLTEAVNSYTKDTLKYDGTLINFNALHSGLIYLLLWLLMQYYQVCLTIEKWYDYLYKLEEKLSAEGMEVSIEGKFYADSYPMLKNFVNFLYTWILPLGIAAISIIRIICLFRSNYERIDIVGLMLIALLSILYFSDRSLRWGYFKKDEHKSLGVWGRFKGFLRIDVEEATR